MLSSSGLIIPLKIFSLKYFKTQNLFENVWASYNQASTLTSIKWKGSNRSIIAVRVWLSIIYFIHLLLNQYCLLHRPCCKLGHLVHFCSLYTMPFVWLRSNPPWHVCFGEILSQSLLILLLFLPITWYSSFSSGWGIIRVMGGVSGRESGLKFQVPLASECLRWPIARTLTVVTCLISRAGRRGGTEVTHTTHLGFSWCVWIWE